MTKESSVVKALSASRYHLRLVRHEQLVLPAGLWALFALMVELLTPERGLRLEVTIAYLGMILPLSAGILAASAIVDDPALELQLAAPRPPWRLLVERLILVLVITGVFAVAFQFLAAFSGVSLAGLGGVAARQLAWLMPCLVLCGLSSLAALISRHSTSGVLLVGLVWIVHVFFREGISATAWGRYLYLFMGARQASHPNLLVNQVSLAGLAAVLILASAMLLRREERYL